MKETFSVKGLVRLAVIGLANLLTLAILLCASSLAPTDKFIAPSGMWSEDENWSLDAVPGKGDDCLLPANSVVTSDVGGTCASFTLGPNASLTVTPGYVNVYGPNFVNQSTITVGHAILDFAQASTTTTISGGGTIMLTDPASTFEGSQNTVINTNNIIQGQGYMGVTQFTNQSLINANVPSGALQLHAGGAVGITNTGTVQASNGGILQLFSSSLGVPFNNNGGIIQALPGSTVGVDGYAVSGGTLISVGSGMFTTFSGSGNPSLSNLTNKANYLIVNGGSTTIAGTITNQGTIQAKGTLFVNGNVTLNGGSVPISAPSGTINSLRGAATLINESNIACSGFIGDANLNLANHGTINATDTANPLVFGGHKVSNSATLEASNGGTLQIQNAIDNAGGTIQALNGSTILIASNTGMVSGGTLTTSGTGAFDSDSGTLDGATNVVTNAGLFRITQGNLLLQGTINNTGTIAVNPAGYFIILNQPTVLEGSGKLVLSPNTAILGSSTTPLTNKSTIEGAGSIGGSNEMGIVNDGIILANSGKNPKTLTIAPDATLGFTNNGKLMVNKGNVLNIAGLFNNVPGTMLSGGIYTVAGTLELQGSIATNAANITLTGSAAQILNSFTNSSALAGLATNSASGSLTVQNGQVLTTATSPSNAGMIIVGTGSGLSVGGSYRQTAGTTTVDGTLTAPHGLTLQKGSMLGKGTLAAAVTSAASLTAGDSSKPAKLTVTGSYTQNSTGTLNISIGSTTVGSFGQLAVSNGVSLGGTLVIKLVNGFVPVVGDTFKIVTGSVVSGQFATVKGLGINSSEHFEISYTTTAATLTVVSGN